MIDASVITAQTGVSAEILNTALAAIFESGIIANQIEKEERTILGGNADEPANSVAESVLRMRRKVQALQSFQIICHKAHQEESNVRNR